MSLNTFAKGVAASAVGLSTVAVGLLYYGQNYLIYPSAFPPGSRTDVATPADYGITYDDVTLDTPDGIKIKAYLLSQKRVLPATDSGSVGFRFNQEPDEAPSKTANIVQDNAEADRQYARSRPTVIMFHGNGGNMGHRVPLAKIFYSKMRCNVLLVSYRGYGHSEGSPSEAGITIDAQTALDFLLADHNLSTSPIILYGQSIGGAVAIGLAASNPHAISALILENTFLSLPSLIPSALPLLSPFAFLCHQKWESEKALPRIPATTPILMLSGTQDEIIPRDHMVGLWEIATKGAPKPNAPKPANGLHADGDSKLQAHTSPSPPLDSEPNPTAELDNKAARAAKEEEEERDEFQFRFWREFGNGRHNDTCIQPGYWAAVAEFVENVEAGLKPRGEKID